MNKYWIVFKMRRGQGWRSLVAYKQKVPLKVTEGQTFLKAASLKRLRLLRMMVDGGIDINTRDCKGHSALICVILSKVEESGQTSSRDSVVEYLLRKGANPNLQDYNGKTALIHACLQYMVGEELSIMQLLLTYNADPYLKDRTGKNALDYVQNNDSILKLFIGTNKESNIPKTVIKQDSLPYDFRDMYSYLTVPDHNPSASPFLGVPDSKEAKWSPKMNRKKPFYCVEELDLKYDNDGETEGVILKCPNLRATNSESNNNQSVHPKVQLSSDDGETRLLIGVSSNQFELDKMKTSLFDWERQLSTEENIGLYNDDMETSPNELSPHVGPTFTFPRQPARSNSGKYLHPDHSSTLSCGFGNLSLSQARSVPTVSTLEDTSAANRPRRWTVGTFSDG